MTKTVRVKIVVMTEPNGRWTSSGWSEAGADADVDEMIGTCSECIEAIQQSYHLIEADVPLPEPIEAVPIEGTVTKLDT